MNHDDPKFTAYAFHELPPQERAEIEALLKDDPAAAQEIAETKEVGGVMRQLFRAELTETLTSRRREAILQAAIQPVSGAPVVPPTNVITPHVAWWRRPMTWQVAAACLVFTFGVYAIFSALTSRTQTGGQLAKGQGIEVPVPGPEKVAANDGHSPNPEVPPDRVANNNGLTSPKLPVPGVGKGAPIVQVPNPGVQLPDVNAAREASLPAVGSGDPIDVHKHGPTVVGPNANPGLLNRAQATVGSRPDKGMTYGASNPGTKTILPSLKGDVVLSGEEASRYYATTEYLSKCWGEASSIHEGSTYDQLTSVFRNDGGAQSDEIQRFVMVRCPFIKVDVKFDNDAGAPLDPKTRIKSISKPYFEPERQ